MLLLPLFSLAAICRCISHIHQLVTTTTTTLAYHSFINNPWSLQPPPLTCLFSIFSGEQPEKKGLLAAADDRASLAKSSAAPVVVVRARRAGYQSAGRRGNGASERTNGGRANRGSLINHITYLIRIHSLPASQSNSYHSIVRSLSDSSCEFIGGRATDDFLIARKMALAARQHRPKVLPQPVSCLVIVVSMLYRKSAQLLLAPEPTRQESSKLKKKQQGLGRRLVELHFGGLFILSAAAAAAAVGILFPFLLRVGCSLAAIRAI